MRDVFRTALGVSTGVSPTETSESPAPTDFRIAASRSRRNDVARFASCFVMGRLNARNHARGKIFSGSPPHSLNNRAAKARDCSQATVLFSNVNACAGTVVSMRRGQLVIVSGESNASNMGNAKVRRTNR